MRIGRSCIESTAGFAATPSALTPFSAATFCRIGSVDDRPGTYIVPAGYVLPFRLKLALVQYTSSPALSSRLTATKASLTSGVRRFPALAGAGVTRPEGA